MNLTNKLTVIVSIYGRPTELTRCFQSINQYLTHYIKVLCVFSEHQDLPRSQLDTLILKYLAAHKVTVIQIPPNGVYSALNAGVAHCDTDFLTFLHSDDHLVKLLNEDILKEICQDQYDWVTLPIITDSGALYCPRWKNFPYGDIGVNHCSSFVKTSIHKNYIYDQSFKSSADWMLVINMYEAGVQFCEKPFTLLCFSSTGISSKKSLMKLSEDLRVLFTSKWTLKNFVKKIVRTFKVLVGYIIF